MSSLRNEAVFKNQKHVDFNFELLYISHSVYEDDWNSQGHSHQFVEMFFILNGSGKMSILDETLNIKKGDLIIINPNITHTELSRADHPLEYYVIGINNIFFLDNFNDKTPYHYIEGFMNTNRYIETILRTIFIETKRQDEFSLQICNNLLETLFLTFIRNNYFNVTTYESKRESNEVLMAKNYMEKNYNQDINLDTLASVSNTSKYYLSHSFKKTYGVSPIRFLNLHRIETAKGLLTTTNYQINQIANFIGFSSSSYFSQSFFKETQLTPSQYRKKYSK